MHDNGAVDAVQEIFSGRPIIRDDGFGMARTILCNMVNRLIHAAYRFDGNHRIEIFFIPIIFTGRADAAIGMLRRRIAAHRAIGIHQRRYERCQMGVGAGFIDQ